MYYSTTTTTSTSMLFLLTLAFTALFSVSMAWEGFETDDRRLDAFTARFNGRDLATYSNGRYMSTRPEERERIRLCGSFLINAIRIACDADFGRKRRSAEYGSSEEYLGNALVQNPSRYDRFRTTAVLRNLQKRGPGASDQCCRKTCTLEYLKSFCPV